MQFGLVGIQREPEPTQHLQDAEKEHDPADKNEG
jgi:hypothetical protein